MKKLFPALILLMSLPAAAQQPSMSPLQYYLYGESGYAPPELADAAAAESDSQAAYAAVDAAHPYNSADDELYAPDNTNVGPSSNSASLRSLLTAAGN